MVFLNKLRAGKAAIIANREDGAVAVRLDVGRLGQAISKEPESEGSSEPARAERCLVTKASTAVGNNAPAPDSPFEHLVERALDHNAERRTVRNSEESGRCVGHSNLSNPKGESALSAPNHQNAGQAEGYPFPKAQPQMPRSQFYFGCPATNQGAVLDHHAGERKESPDVRVHPKLTHQRETLTVVPSDEGCDTASSPATSDSIHHAGGKSLLCSVKNSNPPPKGLTSAPTPAPRSSDNQNAGGLDGKRPNILSQSGHGLSDATRILESTCRPSPSSLSILSRIIAYLWSKSAFNNPDKVLTNLGWMKREKVR